MGWIGTRTLEVPPNYELKLLEGTRLRIELPLEVGTHSAFRLDDLESDPRGGGEAVVAQRNRECRILSL